MMSKKENTDDISIVIVDNEEIIKEPFHKSCIRKTRCAWRFILNSIECTLKGLSCICIGCSNVALGCHDCLERIDCDDDTDIVNISKKDDFVTIIV